MAHEHAVSGSRIRCEDGGRSAADYNERTFRTVIPMTIMGNKIRLTYSNEYAPNGQKLKIGEITLAKGDPNDVPALPDSSKMVQIKGDRLRQI